MKLGRKRLVGGLALATAAFVSMPAGALANPSATGLRLAPGLPGNQGVQRAIDADHILDAPGLQMLERYISGQTGN